MKILNIFIILLFITNCSLNKVIHHHGVHNLEKKQTKLKINQSNRNDIIKIIGPPLIKSTFNNDVLIYIERKTSSSRLSKLGKKNLIVNNVLVLQIDKKDDESYGDYVKRLQEIQQQMQKRDLEAIYH